ncbi:MAG: Rieske 2Fe-2S domain-containing protein [Kordiimonadaceae bacterium]|nr:Rieske 2Fe-2S domain-containing protein [Kordiimonadaceae bacterium]
MSIERDWEYLIQDEKVHRSVYTDPDFFQEEMTKVFGGLWTYLCHESEIPKTNSFKRVKMGLRPLIVTRDRNGEFHAIFNRCAHRAATVCTEDSGVASRFTCSYHGWTYKNNGELLAVPYAEGYGNCLKKSELGLKKVSRVQSYRGFIFGTLNSEMPPLEAYLGDAKKYLDIFIDRAPEKEIIVQSGAYRGTFNANWKIAWDNAADGYHPAFGHRSLFEMTRIRNGTDKGGTHFSGDPDDSPMYCKTFPYGHGLLHQRPGMGDSLWDRARPTPGGEYLAGSLVDDIGEEAAFEALEGAPGAGINLNIFPNLLIIGNQIQVVEPISHGLTQLTWHATTLKGAPDQVNQLRMRVAEDFPNFGEVDDMESFERCWEGLQAPEVEWVMMNRGVHRLETIGADEDGVRQVPPTDESPMRNYLNAYRNIMEKEPSLVVS